MSLLCVGSLLADGVNSHLFIFLPPKLRLTNQPLEQLTWTNRKVAV